MMSKEDTLSVMEESEDRRVKVVDVKGSTFTGVVDLFESRYDNIDDDEPYSGEASICIDCGNDEFCGLYESDIESIKILH